MEYVDAKDPNQSRRSEYEWQRIGDATVLRKCRVVNGDGRRPESEANEIFEFEVKSIRLSKSRLDFGLNSLKALLPKNAKLMDRIQLKASRLNPSSPKESTGVSDRVLDDLAKDLMTKGFLNP